MNSAKKQFLNLLSLTQTFLNQENFSNKKKVVSPESLKFFKKNELSLFRLNNKAIPHQQEQTASASVEKNSYLPEVHSQVSPAPIFVEKEKINQPIESNFSKEISPSPTPTTVTKEEPTTFFKLEPLELYKKDSTATFSELQLLFELLFPAIPLYKGSLESLSLKLKNIKTVKEEIFSVIILSHNEAKKSLSLLKNLKEAISLCLGPARLVHACELLTEIDREAIFNSSTIHLMIATKQSLLIDPSFISSNSESPEGERFYLGKIPLLILSDPSLYLRQPELKSRLWREICDKFFKSQKLGQK